MFFTIYASEGDLSRDLSLGNRHVSSHDFVRQFADALRSGSADALRTLERTAQEAQARLHQLTAKDHPEYRAKIEFAAGKLEEIKAAVAGMAEEVGAALAAAPQGVHITHRISDNLFRLLKSGTWDDLYAHIRPWLEQTGIEAKRAAAALQNLIGFAKEKIQDTTLDSRYRDKLERIISLEPHVATLMQKAPLAEPFYYNPAYENPERFARFWKDAERYITTHYDSSGTPTGALAPLRNYMGLYFYPGNLEYRLEEMARQTPGKQAEIKENLEVMRRMLKAHPDWFDTNLNPDVSFGS